MGTLAASLTLTSLLNLHSAGAAPPDASSVDRVRAGLLREASAPHPNMSSSLPAVAIGRTSRVPPRRRDSIWTGVLIGAGIGAGSGYIWARNICGSNDSECFYIAAPAGMLAGAGIGAVIDALSR